MAGLAAIAVSMPTSAQLTPMNKIPFELKKTLPGQKSNVQKVDVQKAFPMLKGKMTKNTINPLFSQPLAVVHPPAKAGVLTVNPDLKIWSNLISDTEMGIYSFHPTSVLNFEQLATYEQGYFNGGSGLVDDELHGIYLNTQYAAFGIILVYHYSFNVDTWELVSTPEAVNDYSLIATETATDPSTGEIFGQFYTTNLDAQQWGVIDYTTMTRTNIGASSHFYVALGIANDGYAYGIATDGNLYQIDRTTGVETLKGSTGVQVADSKGQYYYQGGEIDSKTNEFYWVSKDSEGNSQLYTVDLNDGHVTPVGTFPTSTTLVAINIPAPAAENGAPAAATDLAANFVNEATTGTLTFKAPDKKFDGSSLTGNLKYSVLANGTEVATGNVEAGKTTTANVSVSEGVVSFIVVTSNDVGRSPRARLTTYAGYDTPNAVANLKLEIDNTNKATLTWDAPTEGLHKGYLGTITYDVYRNAGENSTQVSSGSTATTFSETLPVGELTCYTYSVRAINTTQNSALATSDGKIIGNPFEVPFFDDISTEAASKLYTIIDNNNDGRSWFWDKDGKKGGLFVYKFSKDNTGDDWLMSPPIHMKAGKKYNVSFKACAGLSNYVERLEAKWGASNTIAGMTEEILPETDLKSAKFATFEKEITPTTEGNYYIGFHAISDPDKFYLYLDSISVEAAPEAKAPAAVENLTAMADATGAQKATIKFNAPTKAVDGTALTSITKIEIKNGTRLVESISNPTPGSAQQVVDNAADLGNNNYTVIAYNSFDNGEKATVKVYVGLDIPALGKIDAFDLTTSAKLKWEAATGVHGGLIVPEDVNYSIHNVTDDNKVGDEIANLKGVTEYTVTGLNNDEGEKQKFKMWAIQAINTAGKSKWSAGSIIVGAPYALPFHNSFKNATLENQFFGLEYSSRDIVWKVTKDDSSDGDGGSLVCKADVAGTSTLHTGKLTLKGATAPKVIFDYKNEDVEHTKVEIFFRKKDGTVTAPIWTSTAADAKPGWRTISVDIPAALTSESYVIMGIKATADDVDDAPVCVDNINIADPLQKDAAVEMTAPESAKKGQTVNFNVKVSNHGLDKIENAKVTVTVNGKVVKEEIINKSLSLLQEAEVPVAYKTTTMDPANKLNVQATVSVDNDLDLDNNTASAAVDLDVANVPVPRNLKTSVVYPNVSLTWEAPETASAEQTDDFEGYGAWSLDLGEWKTVDNDHGKAGSLTKGSKYQHQGEEFAFMNWQPSDLFETGQGLDPHSGTKAAVAIYQVNETGKEFINADNWLISPQLSGKAQTVSFWVNNVMAKDGSFGEESFEVLSSSTNNETASFTKIGETHVQKSAQWTEVTIDLPAGTKYFAIHHITSKDQAFIFMVDDAKFEAGSGPVGYNVYRDGKQIGNTAELNYDDLPGSEDKHKYSVTAVYSDGSESLPVEAEVVPTAIENISINGKTTYDVYTVDGKQLLKEAKSLKSLTKGVYVINGKKVIIK